MKKHIILWVLLLLSGSAWAQLSIRESFEATNGDYGYTTTFDNNATINNTSATQVYFTRTQNPKAGFGNPVVSPTPDGSWFWAAEAGVDFNRTIPPATLTLNAIANAQNYNTIKVNILVTDPRRTTSGTNTSVAINTDHMRIQYAYTSTNVVPAASSFLTAGEFTGVNASPGLWYQYVNGVSTGQNLTEVFKNFEFPINSGSGFLFIRVQVDVAASGRELGFDNIRVTGTQATSLPPTLATTDTGDRAYAEGGAALPIFTDLTADNPSGATLDAAKVVFTNGTRVAAQDELTYTIPAGSGISFDAANSTNGALAFTGSSSETNYQNLLLSVKYRNTTSTAARGGTRTFAFTVSNSGSTSGQLIRNVVVTAKLNDAVGLPFTEDFEDDGEGTTYGSNTATSGTQGFVRLTGPPGATYGSSTVFSQIQGSGYFYGRGTKEFLPASSDGLPTAGNNIATPLGGVLQLAPVNTTGFTNLHFKLKAAATSPSPFSTDDFLRFSYNLNNGAGWQAFPSGNFTGLNNGGLRQDGSASGLLLTTTMQDVDIALPAAVAGTNVSFRVEVGDNGGEEIAFDNIQITGTPVPTTVSSIVRTSTNPTNAATVQYTVTFAASVTGLTTSNFTLTTTGTLGATPSVSSVSGSGTTYTVTVNTGTGSGTLRLDLNNSTGLTPSVSNVPYTSGEVYTIDKDGPAVSSVAVPANGTYRAGQTLSFTVNFSEAVTVTGTPQLALTVGATARQAAYASGTGTTALVFSYTVQSGDQDADGIALGALGLNGGTLRDALGNNATLTLNGVPSTAGILVDGVAPTVSSSNRQNPTGSSTSGTSVTFRVTFSETVTGVTTSSFTLVTTTGSTSGSISSVASVSGSNGTQYDVTASSLSGNGTIRLDVKSSGSGITDAAGNALSGGFTGGQTYDINQSVTVVSVTRLTPSPTATAQVSYRVVFSGTVANLTTTNFTPTITSGSISGAAISSVSGSGTTYTVVVNTGTGDGSLRLDVQNTTGTTPTVTNVPYTAGEVYTITKSFAAAPTLRIQAAGSASGNGDVTAFVDVVQVLSGGTAFANGLQNGSFESNNVAPSSFLYQAQGVVASPWSFGTQAGVSRNGSGFASTAYSGDAVALLQSATGNNGSVSQNLAVPTGSYQINFQTMQRNYTALDQRLNVFVNDVFVGNIQPNNIPTYDAFTSATFNVVAPALTATVSTTSGSPTSTSPIPFSVSFSQSAGTTFTASDVTVSGGTLTSGSFAGSGAGPYTFTVTPSGAGTVTVSLATGVANDANNTGNSASNSVSVQYQLPATAAPVVTAPANGSSLNTTTPTYTGTAAANSTVTVYVDGSSIGTTTATAGGSFSLVKPTALSQGSHTVYATAQTSGSAVSANSSTNNFTVDTVRPSVVISSSAGTSGSTTATTPVPFTVTFSETVNGSFVQGDLTVTGGTISGFTAVSGTTFTFNVTPTSSGTTVTVNVPANVAQDAAGNFNTAAAQFNITYAQPVVATAQNVTVNLAANGTATLSASSVNNGSTGPGTLTYTIQKIARGRVAEGSTLTLTTPNGANFTAIRFASYGTPTDDTNGNYRLGSCNAANSVTTAQNSFIGRSTGSMDAVNGSSANNNPTLGDPCGGTPKALAVQAAYSADAGSLSYDCSEASKTQYVLLTVTDGSGNTSTSVAQVTVNPAPTATITSATPNPATPGTLVTVSGTNLSGLTSATLNGAPVTATGISATGFQFTVPASATSGNLVVNLPCSQTLSQAFTVVTPAPVVTAPANGSLLNTRTPVYSGTAPANSTVTVYVDGASIGTTTATASGSFSLTQPTNLADGSHTVYATAQASGTSVSANSNTNTFTIDATRPAVTITSSAGASGGTTTTSPIPFTVTFSENVNASFVQGDVTVTNGAISGFTTVVAGTTFTFNVTPTTAGTATTVTVPANVAQDAAGNFNTAGTPSPYAITFLAPTITLAPASVPGGTVGVAYSQALSASGGTAPYTYVITAGALPSGLSLTNGTIAGTPTVVGTFTFTVTATDNSAAPGPYSGSRSYTLTVAAPTITIAPTTLPNGTQGTAYSQALSASGGTAPYTYAITAGALPAGLSLTNGTISGTPAVNGSFTFTATATDAFGFTGSQAYTLTIAAPVVTAVTWTGTVSTDWFTAGNWSPNAVPTATIDATIPTAPSGGRFPALTGGTANVRNLTLNSGASLTQNGGTVVVAANLTNNGTYQPTGGTMVLGNTAASSILGSSNTRFWNLTVQANGAQSSTSASTSVQRLFTLNGNFTTNGNPLTLESNDTNTALVVNNGSAIVSGTVTVQRYIDPTLNPGLGYRHYSAPVSTATVGSLATASFTPVVNPTYNTSATPNSVRPFPTVYFYDEARVATATNNNLAPFDRGWTSPSALTDPLAVGKGYTVNLAPQTLAVTGTLNNGDLSQTLTSTRNTIPDGGWQLVGNPYPAPLDYSRVANADRVGLDAAIYVYSSTGQYAGQYRTYVGGIGNPVVPSGQGFFTRVAAGQTSGNLTLRNAQRLTAPNGTTFQRTAETRPLVQLTLQGAAAGAASDEAYVYFDNGATAGFDREMDAMKLANPTGLNLAAWAGNNKLAINGLPLTSTASVTVPLFIGLPVTGTYTLHAAQVLNFGAGEQPFLRDLQLGTLTDLSVNPDYTFTMNAANTTPRFELVFGARVLGVASAKLAAQVTVYPNPASKAVFVELPYVLNRKAVTAALVDALGRVVLTQALPAGQPTYTLPLTNLATGVYSLRLQTEAGVVVKKLVVE
ncbi:hypothetical protein GCM10028824_13540 [Hymenobacter segetis]|uniref:Ig domain-containing protein n=1 Tax=Hymenobacter segetis TaxID=2025509 RepID=A0ABU9M0B8_9BACT